MHALLIDAYPSLLAIYGASTFTAAELAVTVGGNPGRIRSKPTFASLCGVAPIPASSGKTNRHRVNHGGDRRGNKALRRIALVRMRHDPRTQAYVQRRLGEGKAKKDWHQRLGSGVHADAIMDRIVHNTVWITTGEMNMREHVGLITG